MPKKYTIKSGDTLKTTFKDGGEFELEGGDDFLKGLYSSDLKRVMNGERAVYFGHLNDKPLINEYPEFMGRIPIKKGPSSIVSNAVTEDAEDVFYKTAKGVFSFLDLPNKIGKKINRFGKKVEESIRPDHSEMEKFARGFVGRLIKIFGKRREMWPGLFVPGEYYENKEDADMAQSFSDAFRDAENKGLKEFEWNGGRYKVERKEDGGKVSSELDITPSEKRIREIVNMVNSSDANFVKRLKQKNRAYLNDWEHEGSIATHKIAVEIDEDGKTYMYPMVQEINGYLHDFTNPRYNAGNFDALRLAKKNNDVVEFDDILEALWFSENYKDLGIYPKFEEGGDLYKNKRTNYIGGSTEEARREYIKLDDKLRKVVKYYSDMYGINPALMMNRLAKEGVVDEGIRHYNSTNGNGASVVDLLEDVTEDTAYSVLGLDDIFTLYKSGDVKTKRKIPFFSSSYTNEKNRVVHSANLKDIYDGFELKAATLRHFIDEARKRHKDLSQEDIDVIANSYYNRGIKGTEDDIRANIKRYKIPDYIKNVDFSNNALDNIEGIDFDIVDGKYTSPEYVKKSNNVIYDIEPLDYFYDTSKSRDAAIKLYNSVFSDEYSEENPDRYDYYNPLKDIQFRFKEGKPYYGNGNIRVYENANGDGFSLVKKTGNSISNYNNGGEIVNNTDKLENEKKEEKRTTDWISSWLDARKEILGKNSREDFESDKSDTEIGIGEYEKQMNQLNSIDRINYDVNGLPVDESKREFLRATVRDYTGNNIEDDKLLNDELKQMFEGFVSSSDSDDRFLYYPKHPTENIRTHENTHALAYRDPVYGPSTSQSRRIADRMNTKESLIEGVEYDDYMDDANEIYSRLMEFRRENNLDPKKKYTKDDIKGLREKYKNKNDDNDSYGVIDRYNDDFLLFLLNDIAYNKNSGDSDIQYAETGGSGGSRWLNDAAYRDSISTERDRYHQERVKRIEDGNPVDINYTIKGGSNNDVDREVAIVMNSLKQNINDKTLSSGLRDALEKIEEDRKEKVGDAKRNVNSVLAGVSLLGALYGIAPGWMNMKFGLDPKKAQLISSSVGLGTDLGQLSLADSDFEKYENSIESAGDLAGIIGSTDVMQRIGRYGPVVDAILDKYGRSAALYDLVKAPYEIYTNVAESIKKYGGMVKMNPGGDIKEKVKLLYDKLKGDAGMSDILALGVIGNLWHESGGLNEEAVGDTNTSDHAYGIQQWRGERKKKLFEFAKNRGHEKPTYEDEVDFLIEEFNTGNGGFLYGDKGKSSKAGYYNYSKSDFLQSGSLSDAVVSWNLGSGRPHKDFIANDSRLKYAEAAAKILGIKIPESESYYGNQGYNPDGVDMRTYMAQTSEEPATFNINITAEKEDNNFDDWMNTYGKEMIASMYARQNEADEKSAEEERLKKAMKEEEERTKAEQAEKRQREALIAAILPNLQLNIKGMSRTES